ncbi:MAG: hypothetical protein ACTSVZ_09175 [Promethearchaeota archaeon]
MDTNSMPNVNEEFSYRVILCKYNEIALKSEQYQKKILNILIDSVKRICIREKLQLQSVLNLQGRLLFFFPSGEIQRACKVFQYIIGIQSFAPAVSSPRKIEKLAHKIVQYTSTLVKSPKINTISLKLRSPLLGRDPLQEFHLKLSDRINEILHNQGKVPILTKKDADIAMDVEIREKGSYIYHQEFPTHFAGFPIQSNKVFFLPWTNSPYEFLAAMMMIRRGAIVIPVKLRSPLGLVGWDSSLEGKSYQKSSDLGSLGIFSPDCDKLSLLARYYADPLLVISLSVDPFEKLIENSSEQTDLHGLALYQAIFLQLMNQIGVDSLIRTQLRMGDRKLHIKGILFVPKDLTPLDPTAILALQPTDVVSSMFLPYFFPLAGLNATNIHGILQDYRTSLSDFSFQRSWLSSMTEPQKLYTTPQKKEYHLLDDQNQIRTSKFNSPLRRLPGLNSDLIFSHLHLERFNGNILEI